MGTRHAERMSASILRHAGLDALIAQSDAEYVALAARLATDAAFRNAQRDAVRSAMSGASITDPRRYAGALEDAYRRALTNRNLHPL